MKYNLSHLTQNSDQNVLGPIQDDEALFLYSLIKVTRIKNIVELGAQSGYSAKNFIEALDKKGTVISLDIDPCPKFSDNHITIIKNVKDIVDEDIPFEIDLLFFDCHDLEASKIFYEKMKNSNKITNNTIIVLHDTNSHPFNIGWSYKIEDKWIHQPVERKLVNFLHDEGWDGIVFHTKNEIHNSELPFRHGLTIMKKFEKLIV
jgi:hypothetical protein